MVDTKLIIVFGLSGVGKTYACSEFAKKNKNVSHYSASKLLELNRDKAVSRTYDTAIEDQYALTNIVNNYRCSSLSSLMLLDAHSLFFVSGQEFIVPVDVIKSMEPNGLLFLEASKELITQRRILRGDKETIAPQEVERRQEISLKIVKSYAETIACPLLILDVNREIDLSIAINIIL